MLFKNQYYYFISGLPDIAFDSAKLPFTMEMFKGMLDEVLKPEDKRLLNKYFLSYDNRNLLQLLTKNETEGEPADKPEELPEGILSRVEIETTIQQVRKGEAIDQGTIPSYFEKVIIAWLNETLPAEIGTLEDLLSSLYMDYGMGVKNSLIAGWFEMNLNLGNLLSAIYARKYGMEVRRAVVGSNEIARAIRENVHARDFGIGDELDYFDIILRIAEEDDIHARERKIDKFRWDWLEENSVFDYFNIEFIFTYLCKLQILERWVSLNAKEGERVFRELIDGLKNEIRKPEDI